MMSPVEGLEGAAPVAADDDSFFQSMFASVDIGVTKMFRSVDSEFRVLFSSTYQDHKAKDRGIDVVAGHHKFDYVDGEP